MGSNNSFGTRTSLSSGGQTFDMFSLPALEKAGFPSLGRLPFSLKILLENLLRREDARFVDPEDIQALAGWDVTSKVQKEIAFTPARVLLQDFTGVPAVVDLAAMRDGILRLGGDPRKVNPLQPVELVIDHSVQVDYYTEANAADLNARLEFTRNRERYTFLRWGQDAFQNFRVVPPDTGIVHQVNLEYLARVIFKEQVDGRAARLSRYARWHRLTHHDGERPWRRRMGCRRHRGRSRDARAADLHADSGSHRFPPRRSPAGRSDRDRPRPDDYRAAAQAGRGRKVRRVLRSRPRKPDHRRPRDAWEHVARVRRDHRDLPDRRHDARLPAADRPRRRADPAGRGVRKGTGALPHRELGGPRLYLDGGAQLVNGRAQPCRTETPAGSRLASPGEARFRAGARGDADRAQGEGRRGCRGGIRRDCCGAHGGRRPGGDSSRPRGAHARVGGGGRDYELHQHVESERDDRRGSPRQERREARAQDQAVGQDQPRAGLAHRHRVLQGGRPPRIPGRAWLQYRRIRMHDVHRQQRTPARAGVEDRQGSESGRRVGPERQPELRRTDSGAGSRQLSGLAASGGRLRARGKDADRSDVGAIGDRSARAAGVPQGHLAGGARDPGDDASLRQV